MNVCIFGGSFDPPHLAHLMLADHLAARADIDKVVMMVSPRNPLKDQAGTTFETRLELCRLTVTGHENIEVSDFESTLPPPYYSYRTLMALAEKYPGDNFSLLIGSDNAAIINRWKNYRELLGRFKVYAYPRKGESAGRDGNGIEWISPENISDLSSTEIRNRVKNGAPIAGMVTPAVQEYIYTHGLYSGKTSNHQE